MHNQATGVEFDPFKAKINLVKHGVSFTAAEEALQDLWAITIEDPDAVDEQRWVTLGADFSGRLLIVVHTARGEKIRLISARKASKGEGKHYHAQGI